MVAIVGLGTAVRGAIEYNEKKVKEGNASLLFAENYHKNAADLTYRERLKVLENRAALHPTAEQKCLHICLSFDPSETPSNETMEAVSRSYMEQLGYNKQPYLVYRHTDTGIHHLHIVTTSIEANGNQKNLRFIGRDLSNPARKHVERQFNLVPAESKVLRESMALKPVDLEKALYGKSETKAAISNIVRSVFKHYNFASLAEFNAVLEQFNVTAFRGEPRSEMYEKEGLVYSLIDPTGKREGKAIKASSIYERPVLARLKIKFAANKDAKTDEQKDRVCRILDDLLKEGLDKETLTHRLSGYNISLVFRTNKEGRIYGVTFVDNLQKVVFNGSELGKNYTASNIIAQLQPGSDNPGWLKNRDEAGAALLASDFPKGIKENVKIWAQKGMVISAKELTDGSNCYYMGSFQTDQESHWLLPTKMQNYFRANGYGKEHGTFLREHLVEKLLKSIEVESSRAAQENIDVIIDNCFESIPLNKSVSKELLREARRKKKRRPG